MVNSINSNISAIQLFRATNAFKSANITQNKEETEVFQPLEQEVKNEPVNFNTKDTEKIEDIRLFASKVGESNISDEDISYGLKYGRSVIADYSA